MAKKLFDSLPENENVKKKKGVLSIAGVITGFGNGMFGSGGGLIAVPALERLGLDVPGAHASAIAVILPLSIASTAVYAFGGAMDWMNTLYVCLGTIPGGLIGAKLLGKLSSVWINRAFCACMLFAAYRLWIAG